MKSRTPVRLILYSLVLVILYPIQLFSQPEYQKTIIPGAKWTIRKGQGMGSFTHSEIYISCETLEANSKTYATVKLLSEVNGANCELGYIREDTLLRKIYFIPLEDTTFTESLIIDYSLEKGDTFYNPSGIPMLVDTVRQIEFFGRTAKFIDFGLQHSDGFIEGFGSLMSGPSRKCEGFTSVIDYEILEVNCNQTTSIKILDLSNLMLISPNPAKDQLFMEMKEYALNDPIYIQVRSPLGKLIYSRVLNSERVNLNITKWPKGILFIQVKKGNEVGVAKVFHY